MIEMAENETPSKTVLIERRDERSLVVEGKSVLEERRDMLAHAIIAKLKLAVPLPVAAVNDASGRTSS